MNFLIVKFPVRVSRIQSVILVSLCLLCGVENLLAKMFRSITFFEVAELILRLWPSMQLLVPTVLTCHCHTSHGNVKKLPAIERCLETMR